VPQILLEFYSVLVIEAMELTMHTSHRALHVYRVLVFISLMNRRCETSLP
jgi:hypothetical protein